MDQVLGTETLQNIKEEYDFLPPVPLPRGVVETYKFEGIVFTRRFYPPSTIEALKTWQARADDVFVISYPKTGTTWLQEIVSAICNSGDLERLNKCHTVFRVPYLERTILSEKYPPTYELIRQMKSPRTIKSHLPGHLLPPDVMKKKAKIVYVARNPKDVTVSVYYFHQMNAALSSYASWGEFFNDFISGNILFGPWWDHYLYYWKKRHLPNVLFIKIEDMKRDLRGVIEEVSDFLGYSLNKAQLDAIVHHCSFDSMKANPMTNLDFLFRSNEQLARYDHHPMASNPTESTTKHTFMRKGKVGDWRCHFTVAQNEVMDAQIEEKLAGSGLTFEYKQ